MPGQARRQNVEEIVDEEAQRGRQRRARSHGGTEPAAGEIDLNSICKDEPPLRKCLEFSELLTKLQEQLNASNKTLSMQISAMNRTFSETLRSTGQFSTHFVNLSSDVDKFGQQLDKGQIKLKQFFQF